MAKKEMYIVLFNSTYPRISTSIIACRNIGKNLGGKIYRLVPVKEKANAKKKS